MAAGRTNHFDCLAFDKADGLPTKVCTGGSQPACWRTEDGHLWFTTDNGAVSFNPEGFEINHLPPPVLIEELRADDQIVAALGDLSSPQISCLRETREGRSSPELIEADPPVKIKPGRHVLEFHYTATSLAAPEKVRFKCWLEGIDRRWRGGLSERTAVYYDVPPGSYKFHVTACNNDGVWNENGVVMPLTVVPHFWQTWWFKLSLVAAILAAMAAGIQIRLMRMRNFTRLRLRISRDIHDEIGCNLGSIAILAQLLKTENSRSGQFSSDVSEIDRITKATIDSLHDIVWFLDPDYDDLHDLVSRMKDVAETNLRGIEWEFDDAGITANERIPLSFRQNALPLFKEILNNIVKHAHATKVRIVVTNKQRLFKLQVTDNGRGFATTTQRKGSGLKNLAWRGAAMKGTINLWSQPGAGTAITFEAAIQAMRDRL